MIMDYKQLYPLERECIKAYHEGKQDCWAGIYDTFWMYQKSINILNPARFYEIGWREQNEICKNQKIRYRKRGELK